MSINDACSFEKKIIGYRPLFGADIKFLMTYFWVIDNFYSNQVSNSPPYTYLYTMCLFNIRKNFKDGFYE